MDFALRVVLGCALVMQPALPEAPGSRTPATIPKIDKPSLMKYLRYAEGFTPTVDVAIDDPKPSIYPGFYEVVVHLKANRSEAVRTYYLTQDGERLISGSVFDLRKSPFAGNLARLKQEGAPAFGPENAPVQIYVFSDFECPYCRQEAKVLRGGIEKSHANDVRIIFKDFPLDPIHPWARTAAIGGQCIARQSVDAFWNFHDWIYEHQPEVTPGNVKEKILEFAKTQNLDPNKVSGCMADPSVADRVQKTVTEGRELGVDQTPTLFVNGRMLGGALKPEQINLLIQMELDRSQKQTANLPSKCCEVSIPVIGKN
jgi:protein-disulfide isomerase